MRVGWTLNGHKKRRGHDLAFSHFKRAAGERLKAQNQFRHDIALNFI